MGHEKKEQLSIQPVNKVQQSKYHHSSENGMGLNWSGIRGEGKGLVMGCRGKERKS